ncbi:MAG: DUF1292 domain-containing protein [Clostridiales bacterium]|nr:DUF1292 domain-containing protein [Clostridiales bacterium]
MSDDMDYIVLYDEEGNESEFEIIATLEVNDIEYAILLPTGEDVDEDNEIESETDEVEEVYILRVEQDENGDDVLVGIEDDDELNDVIAAYEELIQEESN